MTRRTFDWIPGVPAAGHIAGGFWHPGPANNCHKCKVHEESARPRQPRQPQRPGQTRPT